MAQVALYMCQGDCPPGQCDTSGPGREGRTSCAHCDGAGVYDGGYVAKRHASRWLKQGDPCPYCKGDGLGGGYSTATCSKCGQAAIDRAMWQGP